MKTSVKYLGHIISQDGIGPDPETIEKLLIIKRRYLPTKYDRF